MSTFVRGVWGRVWVVVVYRVFEGYFVFYLGGFWEGVVKDFCFIRFLYYELIKCFFCN